MLDNHFMCRLAHYNVDMCCHCIDSNSFHMHVSEHQTNVGTVIADRELLLKVDSHVTMQRFV